MLLVRNIFASDEPTIFGMLYLYPDIAQSWAGRSWNEMTRRRYMRALEMHVLPCMPDSDTRSASSYTEEEVMKVMKELEAKERKGELTHTDRVDAEKALKSVCYTIEVLGFGENVMQPKETTDGKPKVQVIRKIRRSLSISEMIEVKKSLITFMERNEPILDQRSHKIPPGAFAAAFIMLCTGMRDSEAAPVYSGHLKEIKNHPGVYYFVMTQSISSKTGELQVGGKTASAGRKIPLGDDMVKPLKRLIRRNQDLMVLLDEKDRLAPDEIPLSLKIVEEKEKIDGKTVTRLLPRHCTAAEVTLAGNYVLDLIGIRQEDRNLLAKDLWAEKSFCMETDDTATIIEVNPTVYLFRRSYATVMGLLPDIRKSDICMVMGHKIYDPLLNRTHYTSERELFRLYQKINQFPFFNEKVLLEGDELIQNIGVQAVYANGEYINVFEGEIHPNDVITAHFETRAPMDSICTEIKYQLDQGSVWEHYTETALPYEYDLSGPITAMKWIRQQFTKILKGGENKPDKKKR